MKEVDIGNILILLETKIPNIKGPIKFTKSILYDGKTNDKMKTLNEYPYFTTSRKFPKEKLINKSFKDIVDFFFNKKIFYDTLNIDSSNIEDIDSSNVGDYNLTTMIELLFPRLYPVENENLNSFDNTINKKTLVKGIIPFFIDNLNLEVQKNFSYIKIDTKIYTITSTCILNDFLNHPEFSLLIRHYNDFSLWFDVTKKEIEIKIDKLTNELDKQIVKISIEQYDIKTKLLRIKGYTDEVFVNVEKTNYVDKINVLFTTMNMKTDINRILILLEDGIFRNNQKLMNLKTTIVEKIILEKLQQQYFISFNNNDGENDVKKYLDSNYRKYSEFIKEIKKFSSTTRMMSNKGLQKAFDDFYDGANNSFDTYMKYIKSRYFDKNNKTFDDIITNIGINIGNVTIFEHAKDFNYQAYVSLNIIGGELNKQNINQISCDYKNEEIGTVFESLGNIDKNNLIKTTFVPLDALIKKKIGGMKTRNNRKKRRKIKTKKTRKIKKTH